MALAIFAAGGLLDWLVAHRWIPRLSLMLAGAVVALIAGALVFQVLLDLRQRHRAMIDSLERIAEINHHIRNAVQVLAYHSLADSTHSEQAVRQVHEAVERIDWVLREFLPPGRPRVSPETAKSGRES